MDIADGNGRRWIRLIIDEFEEESSILKNGFGEREINENGVLFFIMFWLKSVKYDRYGSCRLRLAK